MKGRFLIHIGYPKTATTTLQHRVFYQLHIRKMINFLGRDLISSLRTPYFDFILLLRDHYPKNSISIKGNSLNVISEEGLVIPYYHYIENNKPRRKDLREMANRLANLVCGDNYRIIVVLRNHSQLIYSLFIEQYPIFRYISDLNSPHKFINNLFNKNEKYLPFFEMFYFFKTIGVYAEIFGRNNIEILFYEDLVNGEDVYFQKWAELLDVSPKEIKTLFSFRENVKEKGKKGYKVKITYGFMLSRFLHRTGLINVYAYLRDNRSVRRIGKSIYKNLSRLTKEEKEFEMFDDTTKERIKEFFREDTLKLAEEFNLDVGKLKKYEYI